MIDQQTCEPIDPHCRPALSEEAHMLLRMIPAHRTQFSVNERVGCNVSRDAGIGIRDLVTQGFALWTGDNERPNARYVQCANYELTPKGVALRKAVCKS